MADCGCNNAENTFCTNVSNSCTGPNLLGLEDMLIGCDTVEQVRFGKKITITGVNASNIPYCPTNKSIEHYLTLLIGIFPYLECQIGNPMMNFGNWDDAQVSSDVDSCAIGLPGTVVQRIPFPEGSITIHNGCAWISLVPNNLSEPSETSQNNAEWLCLSSIDGRIDALVLRVDAIETRLDDLEACCADITTRVGVLEGGDILRVLRVDNRLFMTSNGSQPVTVNP